MKDHALIEEMTSTEELEEVFTTVLKPGDVFSGVLSPGDDDVYFRYDTEQGYVYRIYAESHRQVIFRYFEKFYNGEYLGYQYGRIASKTLGPFWDPDTALQVINFSDTRSFNYEIKVFKVKYQTLEVGQTTTVNKARISQNSWYDVTLDSSKVYEFRVSNFEGRDKFDILRANLFGYSGAEIDIFSAYNDVNGDYVFTMDPVKSSHPDTRLFFNLVHLHARLKAESLDITVDEVPVNDIQLGDSVQFTFLNNGEYSIFQVLDPQQFESGFEYVVNVTDLEGRVIQTDFEIEPIVKVDGSKGSLKLLTSFEQGNLFRIRLQGELPDGDYLISAIKDVGGDETTATTLEYGSVISQTGDHKIDVDAYKVELIAGTTYTWWVEGQGEEWSGAKNFTLRNPDFQALKWGTGAFIDGVWYNGIEFTAEETGTYFLEVRSFVGEEGFLPHLIGKEKPSYRLISSTNNDDFIAGVDISRIVPEFDGQRVFSLGAVVLGTKGDDYVQGAGRAWASQGADTYVDSEIVDYSRSGTAVKVNLNMGKGWGGLAQGDRFLFGTKEVVGSSFDDVLKGVENARAGPGNDLVTTNGAFLGLYAGQGRDTVIGSHYRDKIFGNAGHDILKARGGNDSVEGGKGNDLIYLSQGDDRGRGDEGDDTILGQLGNDALAGGDGNDLLIGGAGKSYLNGGEGDDRLIAGTEQDVLYGGGGNDFLFAGAEHDFLNGGEGADTMKGGVGSDRMEGGGGNDKLFAGAGDDTILAEDGNDLVEGGIGRDYVELGGDDDIFRHADDDSGDTVLGGAGNDTILAGMFSDSLSGGDGNDLIKARDGNDTIDAGEGNDTAFGGAGSDFVDLGEGNNTFYDGLDETGDTVRSGDGNDTILLGYGDSSVESGAGDDRIELHGGSATIWAGSGNDTIVSRSNVDTWVDASFGDDVVTLGSGNDTVMAGTGFDIVDLGGGDDFFFDKGFDFAARFGGTDRIFGGDGNDMFEIREGSDTVSGGNGSDEFRFLGRVSPLSPKTMEITDFEVGVDKLYISYSFWNYQEDFSRREFAWKAIVSVTQDGLLFTFRGQSDTFGAYQDTLLLRGVHSDGGLFEECVFFL